MSDVEALAQTPPPRKPDYVFHCMREEIEKLMEEDGRTGTRHLVDQLMSLAWPPPSASAAMPDEVTITRARYEAYKAAEAPALAAEGERDEAVRLERQTFKDAAAVNAYADQLKEALTRLVHEMQQGWEAGCTVTPKMSAAWSAARAALTHTGGENE